MDETDIKLKKERIRTLLAEFLGTDPEDINDDDSLINDLHVKPVELSDFLKSLEEEGFDTNDLDLTEIDTFEDLTENLISSSAID